MSGGRHHRHRTSLLHTKKKTLDAVRSDINVTPLVDVCLVLLIIFMVVTDKLARGKEVTLPKAKNFNVERENGDELIVSVTKNGPHADIWWDRDPLRDIDALKKKAEEQLKRDSSKPLFVKADADLTYGEVYPILIAIHDAGGDNVKIGTAEIKEKK